VRLAPAGTYVQRKKELMNGYLAKVKIGLKGKSGRDRRCAVPVSSLDCEESYIRR
jgi:hypothetical protein